MNDCIFRQRSQLNEDVMSKQSNQVALMEAKDKEVHSNSDAKTQDVAPPCLPMR